MCGSAIEENMLTLDEVLGSECHDNAGADGRLCIDNEC
jgi:hypothetical protein